MQSNTLLLMTMQWVLIDLMRLDIYGMATHTLSRWRVQPDGGHSSRPTSKQLKLLVAPEPPHDAI